LLIHENFEKPVEKGYIVYVRSQNRLEEIQFCQKDYDSANRIINDIINIIINGFYPEIAKNENKCVDCCYRNICV
jgi:CRISPR-associated exonuclease Cas4